jgi:hypothetical protein
MEVDDHMLTFSIDGDVLEPGMRVEVRDRFKGSWTRGFEIESGDGHKFRVRRMSDQAVLPVPFAVDELRAERKKQGLWWY